MMMIAKFYLGPNSLKYCTTWFTSTVLSHP